MTNRIPKNVKLVIFCIAVCLQASVAYAASVNVVIEDPAGVLISNALVEVYDINSQEGKPAKPISTSNTSEKGTVRLNIPNGKYLFAVKKVDIMGNFADKFTATFYPLVRYVNVDRNEKDVVLETLKLTIKNAKIVPTEIFLEYYEESEKGKRARLNEVKSHVGRVIKLVGAPIASLELKFPKNTVGVRGMRTYTPYAFEYLDAKNTLQVKTFMYDGKIKNDHDIILLGADLIPDKGNRLYIENIQEKSGVEVPFEPKANVINDGVVTSFVSNITFVSDETSNLAKLVFRYFYLDDQEYPFSLSAMLSPAAVK